ncbi:MAG: monoheme cytochrome C [Flavobacteriales bacterium]|nr:monoheme cytochrome C [Flavobacteriales bacterium]
MTDKDEKLQALLKLAMHVKRMSYTVFMIVIVIVLHVLNPGLFDLALKTTPEVAAVEVVDEFDTVENGIHLRTGLIDAEGMNLVINNCTACHSAKIITQNRMTAERWNATIKWMQETQNLWDLGKDQEAIVNYLVTNYPPSTSNGRRKQLSGIEWYDL